MEFLARLWAMIVKEALQLKRDRLTFSMMFGVPIMQLVLFGFAINNDPKALPTAILSSDQSSITRAVVQAIENTSYFSVIHLAASEAEADELLQRGEVQFVITIPGDFTRHIMRGEVAQIAVEADATDRRRCPAEEPPAEPPVEADGVEAHPRPDVHLALRQLPLPHG